MKRTYPSLFDPSKSIDVWFCDEPCCKGREPHRDDGPAVIYPDGTEEWWQHGKKLTDAEVSVLRGQRLAKELTEGASSPVPIRKPLDPHSRAPSGSPSQESGRKRPAGE